MQGGCVRIAAILAFILRGHLSLSDAAPAVPHVYLEENAVYPIPLIDSNDLEASPVFVRVWGNWSDVTLARQSCLAFRHSTEQAAATTQRKLSPSPRSAEVWSRVLAHAQGDAGSAEAGSSIPEITVPLIPSPHTNLPEGRGGKEPGEALGAPFLCEDAFSRDGHEEVAQKLAGLDLPPPLCHPDMKLSRIDSFLVFRVPPDTIRNLARVMGAVLPDARKEQTEGSTTTAEPTQDLSPTTLPLLRAQTRERKAVLPRLTSSMSAVSRAMDPPISHPDPTDSVSSVARSHAQFVAPSLTPSTHVQREVASEVSFQSSSASSVTAVGVCYKSGASAAVAAGNILLHSEAAPQELRQHSFQRVPVRIFLRPGWNADLAVGGSNFSSANVLSLKVSSAACNGWPEETAFRQSWYSAALSEPDTAKFRFNADYRENQAELQRWRKKFQRSIIFQACFYQNRNQINGTLVGSVEFYMDHRDAAELVGFIVFGLMGIPFLCAGTLACFAFKHRKLRARHRQVVLLQELNAHDPS